MTDFWLITGAMIVQPALLTEIGTLNPAFQRIGWYCFESAGENATNAITNPAAGYLLQNDTTNLRGLLRDKFAKPYADREKAAAPVISLYAAGKICQLWNTSPDLPQTFAALNNVYLAAAAKAGLAAPPTMGLAILLGVCSIDQLLCASLQTPAGAALAAEFGYDPTANTTEWQTAMNFIEAPGFPAAQAKLLDSDTWDNGCGQTMLFYAGAKRAAN